MAADVTAAQLDQVAQAIYDWLHEQQLTHRRAWISLPAPTKDEYRRAARLALRPLGLRDAVAP